MIRTVTEAKVPRRMDWRVMIPNQVSIWLSPRGADGGEVERDVRVAFQPGPHLRGVVGGQVVQHDVHFLAAVRAHGLAQEP